MEPELEPRSQWVTCRLFVDAVSRRVPSNLCFCSCGSGVSVSAGVSVVVSVSIVRGVVGIGTELEPELELRAQWVTCRLFADAVS